VSESCNNCKFFRRANERGGFCLRYPPQLVHEVGFHGTGSQVTQHFPYMENDWCGEWQSAAAEPT
jgi:hypothetical protein